MRYICEDCEIDIFTDLPEEDIECSICESTTSIKEATNE